MSEAHKGLKLSDSHRKNISRALTGRVRSDEHCRSISRGRKGIKYSEEAKNNISKALLGRELTESHRKNIGAARKGMKWWVNQDGQTTPSMDCPGEGWMRGMKWRG
jgi:hypothetical protein